MSNSNQLAGANVLTLVRMNGRWFVLKRAGDQVQVRPVARAPEKRLKRRRGSCVVLPFPARVGGELGP